jgi:hypothetical protein
VSRDGPKFMAKGRPLIVTVPKEPETIGCAVTFRSRGETEAYLFSRRSEKTSFFRLDSHLSETLKSEAKQKRKRGSETNQNKRKDGNRKRKKHSKTKIK